VLLFASLIASWGIQDKRTRRFAMTSIVGYIVIGFFDRRAINSGNPYGVFILMSCSVALVDQSLRRAVELFGNRKSPPDGYRRPILLTPPGE
jgi:hypothetical protein